MGCTDGYLTGKGIARLSPLRLIVVDRHGLRTLEKLACSSRPNLVRYLIRL